MANKVRFLVTSLTDTGTIAASSSTTGLPASNVQNQLVRKIYRASGKLNEWVRFSSAGAIDALFIGRHNFTKDATVLWQGNNTTNWATPSLNVTLTMEVDGLGTVLPRLAYYWSSAQSYSHWRLYMRDSTNSSARLEIGRVMAGEAIEPTRNLREGFTVEVIDPSTAVYTAGRQGYWKTRTPYTELTYSLTDIGSSQREELRAIYRKVGRHTAFVVGLDPETYPTDNSWYVQFATDVILQHRTMDYYGVQEIRFTEKN